MRLTLRRSKPLPRRVMIAMAAGAGRTRKRVRRAVRGH
jgi:hypothetical protein